MRVSFSLEFPRDGDGDGDGDGNRGYVSIIPVLIDV